MILSSLLFRSHPDDLASVEGVMEGVSQNAFSGWVWNPSRPEQPVAVELVGHGFFKRVTADQHRDDLLAAGKRTGDCWFGAPVPPNYTGQGQVVALVAGTSHRIRPVGDGRLELMRDWLDAQEVAVQLGVAAQRIALGLSVAPLSGPQMDRLAELMAEEGMDLTQLVQATARLTGAV